VLGVRKPQKSAFCCACLVKNIEFPAHPLDRQVDGFGLSPLEAALSVRAAPAAAPGFHGLSWNRGHGFAQTATFKFYGGKRSG
jgi:hypothetical protein